jgi:hypothetical protein
MRARAPDLDPNYSLERARPLHQALVLVGAGATSLFSRDFDKGLRRATPLPLSRPISLLRKERARCFESRSAIDDQRRVLTRQRMHPVRPGGTATTDSSSPMLAPHAPSSRDESARVTLASTPLRVVWLRCGEVWCALPRAHRAPRDFARTAADPFDCRALPSPIHETKLTARTPEPSHRPLFLSTEEDDFEIPVEV